MIKNNHSEKNQTKLPWYSFFYINVSKGNRSGFLGLNSFLGLYNILIPGMMDQKLKSLLEKCLINDQK